MAKVSLILLVAIAILACPLTLVLSQAPAVPAECFEYAEPQGTTHLSPKPPRVFPFCIGPDPETKGWPKPIKDAGFDKIIEEINAKSIVTYDPDLHFLYEDEAQTKQHRVYRLQHQFKKGSFTFMDYWLNQEFGDPNPKQAIAGLYIQGIQGPLGIPFGEFVNLKHTYNVTNDYEKHKHSWGKPSSADLKKVSLVPCTFFAKAGPVIPNVFVWKGGPANVRFNVTIRWDDPPCSEVAFFQFVMIVVYKWPNTYKVGLSPIILPGKVMFPSTTGLAYPYYPDWVFEEVHTFRQSIDTEAYTDITPDLVKDIKNHRIISNLDYEYCVQHGYNLAKTGPLKGQCPPGPFICDADYIFYHNKDRENPVKSKDAKNKLWNEWYPVYQKFNPKRPHCGVPPTSTTPGSTTESTTTPTTTPSTTESTTTPTTSHTTTTQGTGTTSTSSTTTTGSTTTVDTTTVDINATTEEPTTTTTTTERPLTETENKTLELNKIIRKTEQKKVISHGDLCCLVWFVIIPVANYIARCFKDFPNWKGIGVGFWILAHVVIHHAGVLFMWISFGLVVSNGVAFFGGASGAHYLFGFPCTLIQHYELFSGFIRDSKSVPMAQRQSIVHVINGYISSVFSCKFYNYKYFKFKFT